MKIISAPDYQTMSRKAANVIAAQVLLKPNCVLGLATGSTPVGMYNALIEDYKNGFVDFSKVCSVNLDEYIGLTGDHDQSYRYFMNDHLFDHVNISKENTHVPNGVAADPEMEGARYDALIASLGGTDIQVLGIGLTGHIGFNEPDSSFIAETHIVDLNPKTIEANSRFFASVDDVPKKAITMGMRGIMSSKKILLMANGSAKAEILYQSLFGPITPEVPASILQLHPDVIVAGDEEVLSIIREKHPEAIG